MKTAADRRRWKGPLATGLLLHLALAGCSEYPPSGQIVATVDGEDVTTRDLASEAAAAGEAGSAADMRGPLLARVVDRKLLVREAERAGLQRTPEYLAAIRRLREVALVAVLSQTIAADRPPPGSGEIGQYVRAHPWMFAGRRLFLVEWLADTGGGAAPGAATAADPPDLRPVWIDSYDLSRETAERAGGAQTGAIIAPRDVGDGPRVRILDSRPAPVASGEAARLARALVTQQQIEQALARRLAQARRSVRIRYQQGFGPAAEWPRAAHAKPSAGGVAYQEQAEIARRREERFRGGADRCRPARDPVAERGRSK